jgi:SOS response regulatory protein OraA/RecX
MKRGVAGSLITAAISKLEVSWFTNAELRAEKKCNLETKKGKEKAFRQLTQRGFRPEIVRQIVFSE